MARAGEPVVVVGGGLAGMAAAARLAKLGHPVTLLEASDRLGGAWAATTTDGVRVDAVPSVLGFPAPWRDLFRKSGRPLEAELARTGHALVPAPAVRYGFADGTELALPADRGEQTAALTAAYGPRVAEGWRDLVDGLDEVWQVLRPLGLEAELPGRRHVRGVRAVLRPRRSVEDLARAAPHPHLAAVVRSVAHRLGSDPARTPAFGAVELSVARTFGRWMITGSGDDTGRSSVLAEALAARLRLRRVEIRLDARVAGLEVTADRIAGVRLVDGTRVAAASVVSTVDPWQLVDDLIEARTAGSLRRGVRRLVPARAPAVRHEVLRQPALREAPGAVTETVRLTEDGVPTVCYARPVASGVLHTTHDWADAAPSRGAGVAWRRFGDWWRRPPVTTPIAGLFLAGPSSPAGLTPSAVVLSAALAAYGVSGASTPARR